jgi:hypothetical protein
MASWALVLALSGFYYSGPEGTISFSPKLNKEKFRCFYSTGSSWGVFLQRFSQKKRRAMIRVEHGKLTLKALGLGWGDLQDFALKGLKAFHHGRYTDNAVERTKEGILIKFDRTVNIEPENPLVIAVKY